MSSLEEALSLVFAMGAVILFCRAFPFLFFGRAGAEEKASSSRIAALIDFVEKIVPPAAMTVLAFNALGSAFITDSTDGLLGLGAATFTAVMHLWKRNALISILGGTAFYMILMRLVFL